MTWQEPGRRAIRIVRRYEATPERLFDAWVNPAAVAAWLFRPGGGERTVNELDVRVGGRWTITERRAGTDYTAIGEYLEIDPPRRLVFTFEMPQFSADIDRVIVEIEPAGTGSLMTLVQEGLRPGYEKPTVDGWEVMLDLLGTLIDAGRDGVAG